MNDPATRTINATTTWNDYATGTMNSWNHQPLVQRYRMELMNATLGVAGETGEILQDALQTIDTNEPDYLTRLKDELGDVLYYATRAAEHLATHDETDAFASLIVAAIEQAEVDRDATAASTIQAVAVDLAVEGAQLAEYVKKIVFHAKFISIADLNDVLFVIFYDLAVLATAAGTTLEEIGAANLAKLAARYPQGFTPGGGIR